MRKGWWVSIVLSGVWAVAVPHWYLKMLIGASFAIVYIVGYEEGANE